MNMLKAIDATYALKLERQQRKDAPRKWIALLHIETQHYGLDCYDIERLQIVERLIVIKGHKGQPVETQQRSYAKLSPNDDSTATGYAQARCLNSLCDLINRLER